MNGKFAVAACALALCAALLLTGCKGGELLEPPKPKTVAEAAEPLRDPFESSLDIQYGGLSAQATFVRSSPGLCSLEVTAPESLAGTKAVFEQDKATLSYAGMEVSVDPSSIPGAAAIKLVTGALDSVLREEGVSLSYEDNVLLLQGSMQGGTFTLRVDAEQGNLLSLSMPDEELEIAFRDFKFLS